jgi:hypothetical protein
MILLLTVIVLRQIRTFLVSVLSVQYYMKFGSAL